MQPLTSLQNDNVWHKVTIETTVKGCAFGARTSKKMWRLESVENGNKKLNWIK